jgi:iron-sulfur cluster assembly protein
LITLTPKAAGKIKTHLDNRGLGIGIRVGVRTTGCSGLAYVLEYVDTEPATREQFMYESLGVKVWLDGKSLAYLSGVTVDYVRNGLNEGFEFVNPNERDRCGCGESFRV